jgi:hypothetical protein
VVIALERSLTATMMWSNRAGTAGFESLIRIGAGDYTGRLPLVLA